MHHQVTNPATLTPLESVPESGAEDVRRAVAAAVQAAPTWRGMRGAERAAVLRQIGARIDAAARGLAELSSRESGQPLWESLDGVRAAAAIFERYATRADGGSEHAEHEPPDAVAVLAPFNLPLPVMAAGIADALAAGACVVCKPPVQNPLASLELAKAFEPLPAGAAGLVTGSAQVAAALIGDPRIGRVAFTGSRADGRALAEVAGKKPIDLDCCAGGVHIVCASADLDIAVPAMAWARLMNGGQGWASGHLYVERSIASTFVDCMHQYVGFLDVDDPAKPSTDLGPLISSAAAQRVEDQVGRALREGAKLILGGRRFRPSGLAGHFFQPTILTDVRPGSLATREEIAGPVLTITPVADLGEALRHWRASAGPLDLSCGASLYTGDADAALRELEALDAGFIRINDAVTGALGSFSGLPHRGVRLALGAGPGMELREGHRSLKEVETSPVIERKPWWFPYVDRRA